MSMDYAKASSRITEIDPWLKPFAWLYQLIRYPVLWFRSPRHRKLSSLIEAEKERTKLLRRLK